MSHFSFQMWSIFRNFIDFISFKPAIKEIAETLNVKIHKTERVEFIKSHPGGFIRELYKRRLSIAESYIHIVKELESEKCEERVNALKNLINQSLHAKTISMPLNTARVQIALMKEVIKNKNNKRRQYELLTDFGQASYGQPQVIRKFCKELNLIEVPEIGKPLRELNMGFDFHVHDSLSEGRKTPSQVLLDAFIKGMSELTMVYYTFSDINIIKESFDAAKILGIKVNIGFEFSVGTKGSRCHYMFVPPHFDTFSDLLNFFETQKEVFDYFFSGLKQNAEKRKETISYVLENFNKEHLPQINEGYHPSSSLYCQPIQIKDLYEIILYGQASRIHLGQLLYLKLKNVYFKRALVEKSLFDSAKYQFKNGKISKLEFNIIKDRYDCIREQYTHLNPAMLLQKYLIDKNVIDYNSHFLTDEEVLPKLSTVEGDILYIHPLEASIQLAILKVIRFHKYISHIETFNMMDSFIKRTPTEVRMLNTFVDIINNKDMDDLNLLLRDLRIEGVSSTELKEAFDFYHEKPLIPLCGSDSTGRNPSIPGMGFIKLKNIPSKIRNYYSQKHYALPDQISELIINKGKKPAVNGKGSKDLIISMGKTGGHYHNYLGDEEFIETIGISKIWRYLNPVLRFIIRIAISFPVAYHTVGIEYALVWYGITFFRNVFVDLITASGLSPKEWSVNQINFENTSQSLFWTGFSVPLLKFVKLRMDLLFEFFRVAEGVGKELIRFFVICMVNGSYLASHNKLRNFDNKVVQANFFRSVIAWPFATTFAAFGNLLYIPSIVQAKFWSDFIASIIEGTNKYSLQINLRKRDLMEVLPDMLCEDRKIRSIAMLDILYIWLKRSKGNTCLKHIMQGKIDLPQGNNENLKKVEAEEVAKNNQELVMLFQTYSHRLRDEFLSDGAFTSLNNFIVEEFEGKNAYFLNSLLASAYPKFKEWLEKQPIKN